MKPSGFDRHVNNILILKQAVILKKAVLLNPLHSLHCYAIYVVAHIQIFFSAFRVSTDCSGNNQLIAVITNILVIASSQLVSAIWAMLLSKLDDLAIQNILHSSKGINIKHSKRKY